MKEQKMFMVFADGKIEEILRYKKEEQRSNYRMAVTNFGIYMQFSCMNNWVKLSNGPESVTVEDMTAMVDTRPGALGSVEFSFYPVNVTAILKAENVTKVE